MINKHVLVIGASGYIGSHLIPLLAARYSQITATGRSLPLLKKRGWDKYDNIYLRQLDLVYQDVTPLLQDVDILIFLVHGMAHGHDFIDYEISVAEHLRDGIKNSQIKKVIYLGALQPLTSSRSEHLIARQMTGEILRQTDVPTIELRAGIVIGPGSAALEVMRDFIYHLPVLFTPSWVSSRSSPIALQNLLFYLMALIDAPDSENHIYDVAGPEELTYQKQMVLLGHAMGKKVRLIKLPFLTPEMTAHFFGIITSVPSNIASALVSGLRYHLPADDAEIRQRFPQPLLHYTDAVQTTLAKEDEVIRSEVWGFDPDALERWQPGYSYYPKNAGFTQITSASIDSLWDIIGQIGGDKRYFYANTLWRIREWLDFCVGGKTIRQRPLHPNHLQLGDYIDSWKVISIKPHQHLSLLFGMKAPGLGRLEFTISDEGDMRRLDIRAWWHPDGFSGLLYWFCMMPAHLFIFKGMAKKMCQLAEQQS
ncbi:DUF2867 domain-containing protein [Thaumasiovibrio sp. DFM-14]|uniref:DUF2867 domain-containing protein n=1 Tax=Thaumasiovibrio sp. DFM-14 TaxID=3384792 RepID=UPI00399EF365